MAAQTAPQKSLELKAENREFLQDSPLSTRCFTIGGRAFLKTIAEKIQREQR